MTTLDDGAEWENDASDQQPQGAKVNGPEILLGKHVAVGF